MPVGAIEQHGPHLPVCVDAFVAERVAVAGAQRAESGGSPTVVVAPTIQFGSSHHHLPVSGTLSLRSRTLMLVLADLIEAAVDGGFRRIVIINGHGGNEDITHQAVRDAVLKHRIIAAASSYWTLAFPALCEAAREFGVGPLPGHAGSFETSLMLHLAPHLVTAGAPQVERRVALSDVHPLAKPVVERYGWVQALGGRTDGPAPASQAAGARFFEIVVTALADFLGSFGDPPLPV
jgi:creatinine amidohydrolase